MIAAAFFTEILARRERVRQWGMALMGLGLIFFGMSVMSDAMAPLRSYQPFLDLMVRMENPLVGILVAATFTGLIQSSSATTGIVIVMASQGFITLPAGIALAFGANIGTCITAMLAAIGKPREAVRAATVHVLFNVAGVLVWFLFIPQLADIVTLISPSHPELAGIDRRIRYLQKRLPALKVVETRTEETDQVFFGAWITLETGAGEELTYRIVGADEFDPKQNWISVDSPMARALLKRRVDEEVTVDTPAGQEAFLILEIEYTEPSKNFGSE